MVVPAQQAPARNALAAQPAAQPTALAPQLTAKDRTRDAARATLATAVVDAFANYNGQISSLVARWSPDGTQVVFGSLRDGLPEIYASDLTRPEAPATALTRGPEQAIGVQYTRDGAALVFLRDTSGDENFAIWRTDRDGKNPVNLARDRRCIATSRCCRWTART
jgi:Tol biopolymer transport system component